MARGRNESGTDIGNEIILSNPKVIQCNHCGDTMVISMNFDRTRKKIWCIQHGGWMFVEDYTVIDEIEYGKVQQFPLGGKNDQSKPQEFKGLEA